VNGTRPTWRVAVGLVPVRALPPGRYMARARITRDGQAVGVLTRPFILDRPAAPAAVSYAERAAAAKAFASTLPKFDHDAIMARELLGPMLDAVEKRSATLKDAMVEARAGRYGPAALEALGSGDQTAAAFLRGVDLYAKGQLDQAATQLALAAGSRRLLPRRVLPRRRLRVGGPIATPPACGRSRWEPSRGRRRSTRWSRMHACATDSDAAIDILKPAHAAQRTTTSPASGHGVSDDHPLRGGPAILDAFLSRHPTDQGLLLAAIVSQ
jgi:hypothetical protein